MQIEKIELKINEPGEFGLKLHDEYRCKNFIGIGQSPGGGVQYTLFLSNEFLSNFDGAEQMLLAGEYLYPGWGYCTAFINECRNSIFFTEYCDSAKEKRNARQFKDHRIRFFQVQEYNNIISEFKRIQEKIRELNYTIVPLD